MTRWKNEIPQPSEVPYWVGGIVLIIPALIVCVVLAEQGHFFPSVGVLLLLVMICSGTYLIYQRRVRVLRRRSVEATKAERTIDSVVESWVFIHDYDLPDVVCARLPGEAVLEITASDSKDGKFEVVDGSRDLGHINTLSEVPDVWERYQRPWRRLEHARQERRQRLEHARQELRELGARGSS